MKLQEFKEKMEDPISKTEADCSVSIDPGEIVLHGCGIEYDGYLTIEDESTPFKISDIKQIRYALIEGENFFRYYFENGVEFEYYYDSFESACFAIKFDGRYEYRLNIEQVREIVDRK